VTQVVAQLKPGEYVWAPQLAPAGPVLVLVNLATQRAVVFRNGLPIGASTVSTGRPGYETPTGVFTILQKRVEHYSSTYGNAPMPAVCPAIRHRTAASACRLSLRNYCTGRPRSG
jgi:hypothetical protein